MIPGFTIDENRRFYGLYSEITPIYLIKKRHALANIGGNSCQYLLA